jgi:hypothetical protein
MCDQIIIGYPDELRPESVQISLRHDTEQLMRALHGDGPWHRPGSSPHHRPKVHHLSPPGLPDYGQTMEKTVCRGSAQ